MVTVFLGFMPFFIVHKQIRVRAFQLRHLMHFSLNISSAVSALEKAFGGWNSLKAHLRMN